MKNIFFPLRHYSVLSLTSYHQAAMISLEDVSAALPEQGGKRNAYVDGCIASDLKKKKKKDQVLHEVGKKQTAEVWFLKIALLGRHEV